MEVKYGINGIRENTTRKEEREKNDGNRKKNSKVEEQQKLKGVKKWKRKELSGKN